VELDLSTSLTTGERTTYAAVIDDILTNHGEEMVSGNLILEKLRHRLDCDLAPKLHPIKLLIIERLKKQPTPQTVVRSSDCSASAAAVAVLNLPELLESVLSHLSMEDLFVASRVNKAFHRLIETSPTLLRKLFLLPRKGQPKWQLFFFSSVDGNFYAAVASSIEDINAPYSAEVKAFGRPTLVARINPLLKLQRREGEDIEDILRPRDTLPSAILNKRILEANARPHMYLTDPPCTCVHIDVDYDDEVKASEVLRVRRRVCDPAGVTFGAIYEALHAKGPVALYEGRNNTWYDHELYISPETTIRQQLEFQERDGYHLVLTERHSIVEFCHLRLPSEGDFEETNRTGRVVGSRPPELVD
jgi:hypothetical protein